MWTSPRSTLLPSNSSQEKWIYQAKSINISGHSCMHAENTWSWLVGFWATNLRSLSSKCVSCNPVSGASSEADSCCTRSFGRWLACSWLVWWYTCGLTSGLAVLSATKTSGKCSWIVFGTACFGSPTIWRCLCCCLYCAHSHASSAQRR